MSGQKFNSRFKVNIVVEALKERSIKKETARPRHRSVLERNLWKRNFLRDTAAVLLHILLFKKSESEPKEKNR